MLFSAPCFFFRGFKPHRLVPKMFWRVYFWMLPRPLKICFWLFLLRGKWCFWHSVSITETKFLLQPHLALHWAIYQKVHFLKKILLCPLSFKWPKITLQGDCQITVSRRALQVSSVPFLRDLAKLSFITKYTFF